MRVLQHYVYHLMKLRGRISTAMPVGSRLKRLIPKITWNSVTRSGARQQRAAASYHPTFDLSNVIDIDATSHIEHLSFAYSSKDRPTSLAEGSTLTSESIIVHTSLVGAIIVNSELSGCAIINSTICCGALVLGGIIENSRICGGRYDHADIRNSMLVKCQVKSGVSLDNAYRKGGIYRRDAKRTTEETDRTRRKMADYFVKHHMGKKKQKQRSRGV